MNLTIIVTGTSEEGPEVTGKWSEVTGKGRTKAVGREQAGLLGTKTRPV